MPVSTETPRAFYEDVQFVREFNKKVPKKDRNGQVTWSFSRMVECRCTLCEKLMQMPASRWKVNPPRCCGKCNTKQLRGWENAKRRTR